MGVDAGKDFSQDVRVPEVTPQMVSEAIMVILGHAVNRDDAEVLFEHLGIKREDLLTAQAKL